MNIPWNELDEDYQWAAMDPDGRWFAYDSEPVFGKDYAGNDCWLPIEPTTKIREGDYTQLTEREKDPFLLATYAQIWRKTLVQRP